VITLIALILLPFVVVILLLLSGEWYSRYDQILSLKEQVKQKENYIQRLKQDQNNELAKMGTTKVEKWC
jgi:hypothetical protein